VAVRCHQRLLDSQPDDLLAASVLRRLAAPGADQRARAVQFAGAGAMGVRLGMPLTAIEGVEVRPEIGLGESADSPFLDSVVGLVWRALVLWVFVLLVLTLAQAF